MQTRNRVDAGLWAETLLPPRLREGADLEREALPARGGVFVVASAVAMGALLAGAASLALNERAPASASIPARLDSSAHDG
jgi:hypothetical protein